MQLAACKLEGCKLSARFANSARDSSFRVSSTTMYIVHVAVARVPVSPRAHDLMLLVLARWPARDTVISHKLYCMQTLLMLRARRERRERAQLSQTTPEKLDRRHSKRAIARRICKTRTQFAGCKFASCKLQIMHLVKVQSECIMMQLTCKFCMCRDYLVVVCGYPVFVIATQGNDLPHLQEHRCKFAEYAERARRICKTRTQR